MTPRQLQRAVADALAQEMPSMMDALAERLISKLAPHLAPLFVVQQAHRWGRWMPVRNSPRTSVRW